MSGVADADPISPWFDTSTPSDLRRAYRTIGRPVDMYLAVPTDQMRRAAANLGVNVDGPGGKEPNRWVLAAKRSAYRMMRHHGYGSGYRADHERMDQSTFAMHLSWQTVGLVDRPNGSKAWHIRITVEPLHG
jgi:hypothetical protein